MKKFYAEKSVWGADKKEIHAFDSLKDRNEYVRATDYAGKISAAELSEIQKQYAIEH